MIQKYIGQAVIYSVSLLIAVILVVVGAGFLATAVYFALGALLAPPMAALATGLCLLFAAAVVILLGRLGARLLGTSRRQRHSRRASTASKGARGGAADLGDLVGEQFAAFARARPHSTVVASLLAGFAVGASPGLRRLLRDLIEI